MSKRRAAKILYDNNQFGFRSLEDARNFVRYHTGSMGGQKNVRNIVAWNTDAPTPLESDFRVIEIPKETNGVGLISDLHIPFQDERTINDFLSKKDEYEVIVLLGDVFDFHSISRFSKEKHIDIATEQEDWFQLMEFVRGKVPNHKIYFLLGNHDQRFWKFIMQKARELEHLQGMEFETIFGFDEYNVEIVPMRCEFHYRGLYMGHGDELNCGSRVNPAKGFMDKTKGNYIGGHFHRTSEHLTRNIKDDVMGCWSIGCACDLHPLYAPRNEWNNGYAIVRPYGDENFRVKNIKLF